MQLTEAVKLGFSLSQFKLQISYLASNQIGNYGVRLLS
jgi:hypothetical protein